VQLEAQAILPVVVLLVQEVKVHVRPHSRQLYLCIIDFISFLCIFFVCKNVMTSCSG